MNADLMRHWEELKAGLQPLRRLLDEDNPAKAAFDEYVQHDEFGLALDSLCDSLLDRPKSFITETEIKSIEELGKKMQLADEGITKLRS